MANKRQRKKNLKNNTTVKAKDIKEYNRLKKNSKAKLKRVQDNFGLDLSDKIEIPKMKEFKNVDQFEEWKGKMKSFTDRSNLEFQFEKNKKGLVASKALLNEMRENTEKAKEESKKLIQKYTDKPVSQKGEELGYTVGDKMVLQQRPNVGGIREQEDFDFDKFEDMSRLLGKAELLREKAQGKFFDRTMRQMKENFMKSIKGSFNSNADELIDMIDIIPEDDFFELFLMKEEFNFEDYDSEGQLVGDMDKLNLMMSYVKAYFEGEIDFSLKPF